MTLQKITRQKKGIVTVVIIFDVLVQNSSNDIFFVYHSFAILEMIQVLFLVSLLTWVPEFRVIIKNVNSRLACKIDKIASD